MPKIILIAEEFYPLKVFSTSFRDDYHSIGEYHNYSLERLAYFSNISRCGAYSRAMLIRGRRLFEGGAYSRATLISGRHLFEDSTFKKIDRGEQIF